MAVRVVHDKLDKGENVVPLPVSLYPAHGIGNAAIEVEACDVPVLGQHVAQVQVGVLGKNARALHSELIIDRFQSQHF